MKTVSLILIVCASAAHADCPSPTALDDGGLYLGKEPGRFHHFTRRADGLIVENIYAPEFGAVYRRIGSYGIYRQEAYALHANGEPDPYGRVFIKYDDADDALPEPTAGLSWRGENILIHSPTKFEPEEMEIAVGEMQAVVFDGCEFNVLPFTIDYNWPQDDEAVNWDAYYLPDYGISLDREPETGLIAGISFSDRRPVD